MGPCSRVVLIAFFVSAKKKKDVLARQVFYCSFLFLKKFASRTAYSLNNVCAMIPLDGMRQPRQNP